MHISLNLGQNVITVKHFSFYVIFILQSSGRFACWVQIVLVIGLPCKSEEKPDDVLQIALA